MKRVILHIDRLTLRGVARSDAAAVAESLRAELSRQLAEPSGITRLAEMRDTPLLRAGAERATSSGESHPLGAAVARGIVKGITS